MMSTHGASRCSTSSRASGRASKSEVTVVNTIMAFMERIVALESPLRDQTHPAHPLRGHHPHHPLLMDHLSRRERASDEPANDDGFHGAAQSRVARRGE